MGEGLGVREFREVVIRFFTFLPQKFSDIIVQGQKIIIVKPVG